MLYVQYIGLQTNHDIYSIEATQFAKFRGVLNIFQSIKKNLLTNYHNLSGISHTKIIILHVPFQKYVHRSSFLRNNIFDKFRIYTTANVVQSSHFHRT